MIRKSLSVLLIACAMTLVAVPALAEEAPRVQRRMAAVPRSAALPRKLEKLEGDLQKVVLDGKPAAYAELVDSAGKTVRVYLGPAKVAQENKEKLVVGKHVTVIGARRPAGLLALKIKVDDQTIKLYSHRRGVGRGVAWAWRAGYRAGWADAHGKPGPKH